MTEGNDRQAIVHTVALVRVDADVSNSAGDVAVCPQRDVRTVDHILLRQAKVDHVDCLLLAQFFPADDEIFRLHVPVQQVS